MGKHRTRPAAPGRAKETRFLVCPACGQHVDSPARLRRSEHNAHRLVARVRTAGGYKHIVWRDDALTGEELDLLAAALLRALAAVTERGGRP